MKRLRKSLIVWLCVGLWMLPSVFAAESEPVAVAPMSAEDKEIVEMLDLLETLELLRDMDVLAAMEDDQ